MSTRVSTLIACLVALVSVAAHAGEPFEIREGDRALLLGDTLLERENTHGYLETRMHEQFPDRHFAVRSRQPEPGQNAKEMAMFHPLTDAAEAEIERLKRATLKTGQNEPDGGEPSAVTEETEAGKRVADTSRAPVDPSASMADTSRAPVDPSASMADTSLAPVDPSASMADAPRAPVDPSASMADTPRAPVDPSASVADASRAPADPPTTLAPGSYLATAQAVASGRADRPTESDRTIDPPPPAVTRLPTIESADRVRDAAVGTQASSLSGQQASSLHSTQRQAGSRSPAQAGSPSSNAAHYDFAAWLSIHDLAKPWTDAIASGAWKTGGEEAQLASGLKSTDPTLAGATLSRLFAAGQVPVDGSGPWIELIGNVGGPAELQRLLDGLLAGYVGDCCETEETEAIDPKLAITDQAEGGRMKAEEAGGRAAGNAADPKTSADLSLPPSSPASRAVAALLTAARVRNIRPAAHSELVTALFHAPGEIGLGAIRLAGLWHAPDAAEKLGELFDSRETTPEQRRAAADALRSLGGASALARPGASDGSDPSHGGSIPAPPPRR